MNYRQCPLCGSQHIEDVFCIRHLSDRVKELESKLGAVSQRESATREDADTASVARPKALELSQAAAPIVPAKNWRRWASENTYNGRASDARACDLAAEITRIYERTQHVSYDYDSTRMHDFTRVCLAFVRGEPLPEKGG